MKKFFILFLLLLLTVTIKAQDVKPITNETQETIVRAEAERIRQRQLGNVPDEEIIRMNKNSYSSFGFEYGTIAKYGLLFEEGYYNSIVGYRIAIRSSLIKGNADGTFQNGLILPSDNDFQYNNLDVTKESKSEIVFGPTFRITTNIHIYLGFGYGEYHKWTLAEKYKYNLNTYNYSQYLGNELIAFGDDFKKYLASNIGVTFRLGRIININAGMANMNFYNGIDSPEIIGGISFNLNSKIKKNEK